MCISGVWHGAGWTFVIWGALHGAALVVNHLWRRKKLKIPWFFAWLTTFLFINFSFVIFRARTLPDAVKVLKAMIGLGSPTLALWHESITFKTLTHSSIWKALLVNIQGRDSTFLVLLATLIFTFITKNSIQLADTFKPDWKRFLFLLVIAMYSLLNMGKVTEFLYFQF
jgi:hypothetical protein